MATLPAPPTDHSARRGLSAPLVGLLCVLLLLAAACAPAEDAAEPAAGSTAGATPEDGPGTPTPAETGPGDSDVAAGTPDAATSGADLTNWYEHTRESFPDRHYSGDIEAACGGDPTADEQARRECTHRSPMMHLDGVRDGDVRVYIGHGLNDDLVLPHRPLLAFNQLAEPEDRLPEEVLDAARGGDLPEELHGSVETEPYFGEEDPEVHLARSSGPVTVVLFEGQHDMVFLPGLAWMMVGAPG